MGWMGVMSLVEANRIWELRKARQLHTHALFQIARSWQRRDRDSMGVVHRLNTTDLDDEPLTRARITWSCAGCFACLFPCMLGARDARVADRTQPLVVTEHGAAGSSAAMAQLEVGVGTPVRNQDIRNQRGQHLDALERKQAERQLSVREYRGSRYGPQPLAGASGVAGYPNDAVLDCEAAVSSAEAIASPASAVGTAAIRQNASAH